MYYLITPARLGVLPTVSVVTLSFASKIMQLDELDIARDVEECGRCDTNTHVLIPVEAYK